MTTIRRLEDLEIWKEAKELGKEIYRLTEKFPKSEDYNLKRHLRENARGVPANIAEGFSRYFRKERLYFYDIAKGCLGEMKSDIYFSNDVGYLEEYLIKPVLEKIDRLERRLNSFIGVTAKRVKKL